ncbi:hypothetical protein [Crossiella sp. CA198]|uniref:hypothetical protein n=1 Tax=Crossiella sp. CA198 TaxID=3455607 RepID=UPI003F8D7ED2
MRVGDDFAGLLAALKARTNRDQPGGAGATGAVLITRMGGEFRDDELIDAARIRVDAYGPATPAEGAAGDTALVRLDRAGEITVAAPCARTVRRCGCTRCWGRPSGR